MLDSNAKYEIVQIECQESDSEIEIKRLVNQLNEVKLKASATAAKYRKEKEEIEEKLIEACSKKSYSNVSCRVIYDWKEGKKRYFAESNDNPHYGSIVKEEPIPAEELRTSMNNELEHGEHTD